MLPARQFTWNVQGPCFLNYDANHITTAAAQEHDKIAEELYIVTVL